MQFYLVELLVIVENLSLQMKLFCLIFPLKNGKKSKPKDKLLVREPHIVHAK